MVSKIVYLLYYITLIVYVQSREEIINKSTVMYVNDTNYGESESTNDLATMTSPQTEVLQAISEVLSKNENSSVNVNILSLQNSTLPSSPKPSTVKSTSSKSQNYEGLCECDLTAYLCDINCCCDVDCKNMDMKKLFTCTDQSKVHGTHYCYDENLTQDNKTRYLFEKLRDNLFCIAYDNTPPVYSSNYDLLVSNRTILYKMIKSNEKSRFKWEQNTKYIPPQYYLYSKKPYQYRDTIWKIQNKFITKLELPQTGFTGICSFKKALMYLKDWTHSCIQVSLENTNKHLFVEAFNNFSVIASPVLYDEYNLMSDNQSCSKNICIPVKSHYCLGSWNMCQNKSMSIGKCYNGTCSNIVKCVRYLITHNGTKGINGIDAYIQIGNASEKFYQSFEVTYKWLQDAQIDTFDSKKKPGYALGRPIIIGNLITNKTNATDNSYLDIDKEYSLSLPVGKRDGTCDDDDRYVVNFGEDLKLSCKVQVQTLNFSINSCVDLQKLIIDALLKKILFNVTKVNQRTSYVSKWSYLDENSTDAWVKILFDRIPENVVTSRIMDNHLMCSGLIPSLKIDIVHRRLLEPKTIANYEILGAAITFSENSDIYWTKCETADCIDTLVVDILSYVMFHEVSQPSRYSFAEGSNLDIALPYDFFYPFINDAANTNRSHLLTTCTSITLIIIIILM